MISKTLLFTVTACMSAVTVFAAEPAAPASPPVSTPAKPAIAKICTNCHKAEPGAVRGYFDIVTFKAKTIQVKIDDAVELFKFDEDEIKVVNGAGKTGDGEFLKDNLVKKGHEIKVEYTEKDGVKTAVKLIAKPPVKVSPGMVMKTADMRSLLPRVQKKGTISSLIHARSPASRMAISLQRLTFRIQLSTSLPKNCCQRTRTP